MDPPKHNAQTVDHHKLLMQVNQVHTVHKAMSAKESAFFLMYGRDPLNKLSAILNAPTVITASYV